MPEPGRFEALDGLRGVAALIVVLFHFGAAFTPRLTPGQTDRSLWVGDTPLGILFNGQFAVSVFFVLSGFVVANAAAKRRSSIPVNLVLRYLRLALPATASVLLAWALLSAIPDAAARLDHLMPHQWLRRTYQGAIPGPIAALHDGAVGIFLRGQSDFNNVLWTMRIEAIGSFAIYVVYGLAAGRLRSGVIVVLGMAAAAPVLPAPYLGFALGALLREAWIAGRPRPVAPLATFLLGVLLGFPTGGFVDRAGLPHLYGRLTWGSSSSLIAPCAAALIVYGVLYSHHLTAAFAARGARFLGRISFPLYLVHVPLLYTVFAAVYVTLAPVGGMALLALFVSFLATAVGVAWIGEVLVDAPVLRLLARLRGGGSRPAAVAAPIIGRP